MWALWVKNLRGDVVVKHVVANWKNQQNPKGREAFCEFFANHSLPKDVRLVVCPSFLDLALVHQSLKNISVGAQTCDVGQGTCTGTLSSQDIFDRGGRYCLLGHSERRQAFDESVADRWMVVHPIMTPVICLGYGMDTITIDRLWQQALDSVGPKDLVDDWSDKVSNTLFAIEPTSAIGHGGVAPSAESVASWCHGLQARFQEIYDIKPPVLYGGSVGVDNANQFRSVDGVLVGRASLDPESLYGICQALTNEKKSV